MKITLGKRGGIDYDITPFLDENATIVLTQELERDAFERTVEDLSLRLSNIDRFFSDIFRDAVASTRFPVTVSEGSRVLFRGEVDNESIRSDERELWVEMDVFSMNRIFWDRAKPTKVRLTFTPDEQSIVTSTLEAILRREIDSSRVDAANLPLFEGDLFSGFSIDEAYSNRPIRFYADSADPEIGNNGKYANLDPATTVFDLLTAMSVYYNAEFFINPETEEFTMRKRLSSNENAEDISGTVLDSSKIDVMFLDRNKYDYIYTMFAIAQPVPPVFDRFESNTAGADYVLHVNPGGKEKLFKYYLTYVVNDRETPPSVPLDVVVPGTTIYADFLGVTHVDSRDVRLTIPEGYPGTARRYLYRTEAIPVGSTATQIEGPEIDVASVAVGNPSLVTTSLKHNFSKGDIVRFSTTGSVPNLNGSSQVLEVKSGTSFTVAANVVSAGNRGTVRKVFGPQVVDLPNVYLLAVIEGNAPVSYRDGTDHSPRCNTKVIMPQSSPITVSAWIGYDESVEPHAWRAPVLDVQGGSNTPTGRIFDVVPRLNFASPNIPGQVDPYNLYDVFSFFGKDNELGSLTGQWENLLRTIRGVTCSVKGMNFRVGDEVILSGEPRLNNSLDLGVRLIVKKAAIDLIKEETELELICL